jgi:hypothetical protein
VGEHKPNGDKEHDKDDEQDELCDMHDVDMAWMG